MRRRTSLIVEPMEVRALLSGLTYSVTTDQSTYEVGQAIQITFTETNTSNQPITVSVSPTDFFVFKGSNPSSIWESNPANDGQPPTEVTLQPWQSEIQTATWDGAIAETVNSTTYAVNAFGAFEVSNPNAPQGDTAAFQITNPLRGDLTTDQTTYQVGQPVQLTYTETNTSDQTLTISTTTSGPLYQIEHDSLPMLPVSDPTVPAIETITPGQTVTSQYTWNPQQGAGNYTQEDLTGTFIAMVYDTSAGTGAFYANFQIDLPPAGAIVSSVTTDQPVYQNGQTVTMTFTETNVSDQSVMVPTGQNGFIFDPAGPTLNPAIGYLPTAIPAGTMTLQPGQSWTQTETWSFGDLPGGPYTLEISNVYDPNVHTATFEVAAPSSGGTAGSGTGNGGSSSTGQIAPSNNSAVTTNHAAYEIGEVVRIRMKIPGTGEAKTAGPPARAREQITILDDTQVVSRLTRRVSASTLKHLEAGRPVTLTTIWNGRSNQPGIHSLKPGAYTIDVAYGDDTGTTTISVSGKASSAVGLQ